MQESYLQKLTGVVWGEMISGREKWQREEKEKEFKSISRCKANRVQQVIGCGFGEA